MFQHFRLWLNGSIVEATHSKIILVFVLLEMQLLDDLQRIME